MENLSSYILAIHQPDARFAITNAVSHTRMEKEADIEVEEQETVYTFENGVVIRYTLENSTELTEQSCDECWVTYEVLDNLNLVSPKRKTFYNRCQETFWLETHQLRAALD
ncbi:hypothetical protein [Photobacterium ganghwense]|uniref:hypothetical protein n=1 Tax=Photobacterium ganghwense TaxID=320778 RepID=UPI001C2D513A|nr:hypothetical protein [Photobacterium ganghwense]MBV1841303.1 hypothetical protein [Photobacterium ganghwense]